MNLKDSYAQAMLDLYTLLVLDAKRCQTLILQSRGLGYGIAYWWIYDMLHPLWPSRKDWRHTYSKDTIISGDWKHKRFDWLQNQKGAI